MVLLEHCRISRRCSGPKIGLYLRSAILTASLTNGGLKLPPFPSRERDESNPNEAAKAHFTPEEAAVVKETLFTQLDDFDACVSRP